MSRPSPRPPGALLAVAAVVTLTLAACDGDGSSSSPTSAASVSPPAAVGSSSPGPPYAVYSPPPPPSTPITSGYLGETLTLDVGGGRTLRLTFHSAAMNAVAAIEDQPRHFSVWLTVENPSDAAWRGDLGTLAHITDDIGGDVAPDPSPAPGDYSSAAKRFGFSNRNLARAISVPAGGAVDGVLLFQLYGGNRVVHVTIDSPSGGDPIAWETNFGVF